VKRDFLRSPACIFLAPAVVLTVFYLDKQAVGPEYYGLARIAQAASAAGVIVPLCAGLAAWEGARFQRGAVAFLAPVRSEPRIALRALAPICILAAACFGVATTVMLASGPTVRLGDFAVLLVPAAVVSGHCALAYAAGRLLPSVFAVPLAVLGSWLWIVYPMSIEPVWVRHLTGYLSTCCDTSTVLARGAFVAPIVISLASWAAAGALLMPRLRRAQRAGAALVVMTAAVVVSISLVNDLGSEPVAARPEADLECIGKTPRVCLWPEHRDAARIVARRARVITARLAAAGVKSPGTVSESGTHNAHAWTIGVEPGARVPAVDATLIEGLVPPFPPCANGPRPYPGGKAYWPLVLWLARTADTSTQVFRYSVTDAERHEAAVVQRAPRSRRLAWYRANIRAVGSCGPTPKFFTLQ
jgi:hypothetical protein